MTYNLPSLQSLDFKELTKIHLLAALGYLADATSI
jgi:hypothetical protein